MTCRLICSKTVDENILNLVWPPHKHSFQQKPHFYSWKLASKAININLELKRISHISTLIHSILISTVITIFYYSSITWATNESELWTFLVTSNETLCWKRRFLCNNNSVNWEATLKVDSDHFLQRKKIQYIRFILKRLDNHRQQAHTFIFLCDSTSTLQRTWETASSLSLVLGAFFIVQELITGPWV